MSVEAYCFLCKNQSRGCNIKMPYSRVTIYFALLFLQFLPLKHSPVINNRHKVFSDVRKKDVLASQWTDNKIVESLGEKYHAKSVCLGNICDIWLGKMSENVRMVEDP